MVLQNRAFKNLFVSPNRIEDVAMAVQRIESGDVKLRVRALDSERALTRVMVGLPTLHPFPFRPSQIQGLQVRRHPVLGVKNQIF